MRPGYVVAPRDVAAVRDAIRRLVTDEPRAPSWVGRRAGGRWRSSTTTGSSRCWLRSRPATSRPSAPFAGSLAVVTGRSIVVASWATLAVFVVTIVPDAAGLHGLDGVASVTALTLFLASLPIWVYAFGPCGRALRPGRRRERRATCSS